MLRSLPSLSASSAMRVETAAQAHGDRGNHEDAIACYKQALYRKSNFPDAFAGLLKAKNYVCDWTIRGSHLNSLAAVLAVQLQLDSYDDEVLDSATHSVFFAQQLKFNNGEEGHRLAMPNAVSAFYGCLPCIQPIDALALTDVIAPRDVQRLTRRFAARARANIALSADLSLHHSVYSVNVFGKTRIHVGYLSANFGNHPVGHLLAPLLEHHNKARFFVTCYSLSPSDQSTWWKQIETGVEGCMKDLSLLSASDAARVIQTDGVNLLAHLDGHTANSYNEILALRPALIQLAFVLGFHGTHGADYLDYLVADQVVLGPRKSAGIPGTQYDIDENALVLPNSCIINGHSLEYQELLDSSDGRPTRTTYGLPEDAFVFAYFGQLDKLDPIVFATWMGILKCVPNSVLWLHVSTECVIDRLRKESGALGISERQVHFTDLVQKRERVYCNVLADLVLDTPFLVAP
mmetsp:Transcript_31044/g.96046  ORF Transcript_31044/g.96046 Transcript_31044/m.96046 type:complete len:462 (-) Transcript_31044:268-1653(-)